MNQRDDVYQPYLDSRCPSFQRRREEQHMKMSFEEFQATRVWCDDIALTRVGRDNALDESDDPVPGFIYLNEVFIEQRPRGEWYLYIERSEYKHSSLARLEEILYEWACAEDFCFRPIDKRPNLHAIAANLHAIAARAEAEQEPQSELLSQLASELSLHLGLDDGRLQNFFVNTKASPVDAHVCLHGFHLAVVREKKLPLLSAHAVDCTNCGAAFDCVELGGECPLCGCSG